MIVGLKIKYLLLKTLIKELKFTLLVNFFSVIFFKSGDRRTDYE